jgi:hypothetical protein
METRESADQFEGHQRPRGCK